MNLEKNESPKTIELWEGRKVRLERPELLNDFDFVCDLRRAKQDQDVATLVDMYFVLIGGQPVLDEVRQHIIAEKGVFDINELFKIIEKINDLFPKASSPAQKRW